MAMWHSIDGVTWQQDPRRLSGWPSLCTHLEGYIHEEHWLLKWHGINMIDWRGRLWFIGAAGPSAPAGEVVISRLVAAPLSADLRGFAGRPIDITPEPNYWEGPLEGGGTTFEADGHIYMTYRQNGHQGDFGIMEVI